MIDTRHIVWITLKLKFIYLYPIQTSIIFTRNPLSARSQIQSLVNVVVTIMTGKILAANDLPCASRGRQKKKCVREVQRSIFYGIYVLHFTKWTSSTFKKCSKQTTNLHHEHRMKNDTPQWSQKFAPTRSKTNSLEVINRCSWCKLMVCFEHFLNVDDVHFVKCNTYIP